MSTQKLITDAAKIHELELAALAGVTTRRIRQLAEAGKIPPPVESFFPAFESISKLITHFRTANEELRMEKLAKLTAERKLRELELDEAVKRLIPFALVECVWTGVMRELTTKISHASIPDAVKNDLRRDLQSIPIDQYFLDSQKESNTNA